MKKLYEEPILKVTELPNDVLTSSGGVQTNADGITDVEFSNLFNN